MLERFATLKELKDFIRRNPISHTPHLIERGRLIYFYYSNYAGFGEIVGAMEEPNRVENKNFISVAIQDRYPTPGILPTWGHDDDSLLKLEGDNFWNVSTSHARLISPQFQLELF